MIVQFKNVGQYGIIKDVEPYELPLEAWSAGNNIRFNDTYLEKIQGHEAVLGTPSVAPLFTMPVQISTGIYWVYANASAIYGTEGATQHSLGSGYTATADRRWSGSIFGGIPLMVNPNDTPQMLFPASIGNSFSDLSNWPTDSFCKTLIPFKYHIIGLNWIESGDERPFLIRWSTSADPGTVPSSWDYTSATNTAGRTNLSDEGGHIIDGGTLGDSLIIYRESGIHEMRYVGGQYIFNIRRLPGDIGIYSDKCFTKYPGGHVLLTGSDLVTVTASGVEQSVIDSKDRDDLFDTLNAATNAKRAFLSHNQKKNEVWVHYPTTTDTYPTKALIWNYRHNTTTFRDCTAAHANYGEISPATTATWDSDSEAWDDDSTVWDDYTPDSANRGLMLADATNTGLFKADSTNQFNGTSFTATIERSGLNLGDSSNITHLKRIYPKISGTGPVTVYTGYENYPGEGVTWDSGASFTPGTDHKVDCRTTGRYLAVKFETIGNTDWKLHGYDAEVIPAGRR